MAGFTFQKAKKEFANFRISLAGPSGSGKTYSGLRLATGLVNVLGGEIAVIDTEQESASLYADLFDFSRLNLNKYDPDSYKGAIKAAAEAGFTVLLIDSLSHAWAGADGLLEKHQKIAEKKKDTFRAWADITPEHNALVDALLSFPGHIIVTVRTKTEWDYSRDERTGRLTPQKVGTKNIFRDGLEYEMTAAFTIDEQHEAQTSKDRTSLFVNREYFEITENTGEELANWLKTTTPKKVEKATATTDYTEGSTVEKPPTLEELEGDDLYQEVSKLVSEIYTQEGLTEFYNEHKTILEADPKAKQYLTMRKTKLVGGKK